MGFQVAGRCRPLSKFMEFLQDLILMASVVLLSQYPLTDLTTLGETRVGGETICLENLIKML